MPDKALVESVMERLSGKTPLSQQSVEQVLETLREMGLLAGAEQHSGGDTDPAWTMRFRDYLTLGEKERRRLLLDVQKRNQEWINQQLDAHHASWILVCEGKVIESSADLDDYPSTEELMQIGYKYDCIPFVFTRSPLVEETTWSPLPYNDFYPTISIGVGAGDWDHSTLLDQGRQLIADFDTGSPRLFVIWEWLLTENLVQPAPVDFPQIWHHLGREYTFYTRILRVGISDESGLPANVLRIGDIVLCVKSIPAAWLWQAETYCSSSRSL